MIKSPNRLTHYKRFVSYGNYQSPLFHSGLFILEMLYEIGTSEYQ